MAQGPPGQVCRDSAGMLAAVGQMDTLVEEGENDAVWVQVTPPLSPIAALPAAEQKCRMEMNGLIRAERPQTSPGNS
jgi:hypothetical protein